MDIAELMEWLAQQGITTVLKVDGERVAERRAAWMVVASGGPLAGDAVRVDARTVDGCLDVLLARLEARGLSPFAAP